ncbi:MAG TPA: hypothetical protein VMW69_08575 [Spirochaetia bacterium]|nr:hypothetical protein [Spirochaetia bacterium]
MDAPELCESLIALMERETGLLEHMVGYEVVLKESVMAHNWTRLELAQRKINPVFEKLSAIEAERHMIFGRLQELVGEDSEAGFYEVFVHFERNLRERAADAYRTLKFTVLKIQGMTNSIDIYLKTVTGAMQEILAELFPFRKGNLYTRKGTATQAQANPMVFSRQL